MPRSVARCRVAAAPRTKQYRATQLTVASRTRQYRATQLTVASRTRQYRATQLTVASRTRQYRATQLTVASRTRQYRATQLTVASRTSRLTPAVRGGTMERSWFLTWRTYGTRLPGSCDGFVSPVVDAAGKRVIHNTPGTPQDADHSALENYAHTIMKGDPIYLNEEQAKALFEQFQETARFRHWRLVAVAILVNHVHLIVTVDGDPEPETLLRDFKAYGSRGSIENGRSQSTVPGGPSQDRSGG